MKLYILNALLIFVLLFSVVKADAYLPIVRTPGQAEMSSPLSTTVVGNYAVVRASLSRFSGPTYWTKLLDAETVKQGVSIRAVVQRDNLVTEVDVFLLVGQKTEINLGGGVGVLEVRSTGELVFFQTIGRANWFLVAEVLWI